MKRNENKKSLTKKIVAGTGLALLLALVGYTGANTYAKYISSATTQTQSATVAKWGVVVSATTAAFAEEYINDTKAEASSDKVEVSASNLTLAPGTKGSLTITVSGQPEVASQLKFDFDDTVDVTEVHYGDSYYPVVWTFKAQNNATIEKTGKLSEIATYVEGLNNLVYAPNAVNLADTYTLSWEWPFETGATPAEKAQNNLYDTYIANKAVGTSGLEVGNQTIEYQVNFKLNVVVEQLDKLA